MSRSALVTGATGFIGQHLVCQLAEAGWWVRVICRTRTNPGHLPLDKIERVRGDITDPESLSQACDRPFDAVFHVAASTNLWRRNNALQNQINVDGTHHMLMAARNAGVGRFIHTSSVAVYGFQPGLIREETRWDENSHWINYVRTKAEAETLVKEAASTGMDCVILNPAHVMGPWDHHNWIQLIQRVARQDLPGIPAGSGSFADVRQVARAHIAAAKVGRSGENYLLGGPHVTFAELVTLIAETLKVSVKARRVPVTLLKALALLKQGISRFTNIEPDLTPEAAALVSGKEHCDSSKAEHELGYASIPIQLLIEDTVSWAQEAGLL